MSAGTGIVMGRKLSAACVLQDVGGFLFLETTPAAAICGYDPSFDDSTPFSITPLTWLFIARYALTPST